MKKMIVCALLALLVLSCSACNANSEQNANQGGTANQGGESTANQGSSDSQSGETVEGSDSLEEGNKENEDSANVEMVDYVQTAVEKARLLTTEECMLTEDGEIIIYDKTYVGRENIAELYASMDIRELHVSVSNSIVLAVTNNGELYCFEEKIDEGVTNIAFTTTNVDEWGRYITEDGVYHYIVRSNDGIIKYGENADEIYEQNFSNIVVEGKNRFLITNSGKVRLLGSGGGFANLEKEISTWNQITVFDAALGKSEDGEKQATIAAIQGDGTVLAVGDYAEEILSWGPLAYISMRENVIVGLKTDGTVKVAGRFADVIKDKSEIESWTNIKAVKVGNRAIQVVDDAGNYYYVSYYARGAYDYSVNSQTGSSKGDFYLFHKDGSISCAYSGEWKEYTRR